MKTGASMGEGYGPIIVSKKYKTMAELEANPNAVIAQPGKLQLPIYYYDHGSGISNPLKWHSIKLSMLSCG